MENNYLAHHGILGMKWGVRRYQNEDGSLTPAGRERYQKGLAKELKETYKKHGPLAPISSDAKNLAKNSKVFRRYEETFAAPDNFLKSRREQLKSDKEYAKKYAKRYFEHERDLAKESANSQEALDKMISIIDQDEKSVGWAKDSHLADEVIFFNEGDKYDKLIEENIKAAKEWSKENSRIAKDALGKYGDVKLEVKWNKKKYKTIASDFLQFALDYADVDPSINNGMDYSKLLHTLFSDEEDDHLEHHGILGMKWYHRRFQNEDGSLTPAGRERYGVGEAREGSSDKPKKPGIVERHKQKKEEKRKAAEKAARVKRMQEGKAKKAEERKSAEEHEAAKQKALTSGKATEVLKYRDELSNQEVKDALSRVEWEKALRKNAKEENPDAIDKAMKVIERYGGYAKTVGDAVGNSANAYNNIAKVMNTFTGSDWPMIDKKMTRNERIRDEELTKQALIKTQRESEGLSQDREKTKQAREATSQAYEATTQAEEATIQSKQKTMQGAEDISQASERTKQEREYTKQERYKTTQESERSKQEQYKTAQESERSKQEEERSNQQRERTTQAKQRTMEGAEGVSQASERTKQERENTTQAKQRTMAGAEGVSQASERTKQERYKTTQEKYKAEQERQKAEQAKRTADSWTSSKSYTDIVSRPMDSSSSEEAQKTGEHWVFNSSYLPLGHPDKRKRLTDSKG